MSGPATFALTHALTGGGGANAEFVSYETNFDAEATSENTIEQILEAWENKPTTALECLFEVTVNNTRKGEGAVLKIGRAHV